MAKAAKKANAAFMKPVQPDATLAAVVGSNPIPRPEVTKRLWDYIKKHKLQDAKKRPRSTPTRQLEGSLRRQVIREDV